MNERPSDEKIIDYLFGYLEEGEKGQIENYAKENPAFAKEVKKLADTRKVLSSVEDEEVIEPPISQFLEEKRQTRRIPAAVWTIVSIAASLSLVILIGFLTQFNVSYQNNEFKAAFGKSENQITPMELQHMLSEYQKESNNNWQKQFVTFRDDVTNGLSLSLKKQQEEISDLAKDKKVVSDARLIEFMHQLNEDNAKSISDFYKTSTKQQEQYLRSLFVQFYDYMDKQREEDLKFVQANLLRLKSDTDERQEQTEQVLARIITTVNEQNSPGQ